ncbi:MAG: sensor histidine kinase KdpD [Anaerolineae bacterium]|nr:sensor histidine kinase KdpD [Anaerolineae bacterium]
MLAQVQKAETQQVRGKLKIFLGYVAGVGKTYAMLEAARRHQAEEQDVVVAYVETHGRPETEALLAGLELIPRRQVAYRGVTLPEMDLDAVLARRPQVALVDELAHTNAPGSRHSKRFQDVLELLAAGIDVYTTLNIQHLESLNDVVAQITGVVVRETLPDRLLEEANEIKIVDLPTDELLQRLEEGKVYIPAQAQRAAASFFRRGNLTALRELTLRQAADRIDEQMRAYMQTHAIAGPWPAHERILVAVSPSPMSEKLVRTACRLATRLNAEWYAVYVETGRPADLPAAARERVTQTLTLAETLGAETLTLTGSSVAEAIVPFAQTHNITKIVAGKPLRPHWQELWRGSVIDQIVRQSGDIDIYVINSRSDTPSPAPAAPSAVAAGPAWSHYLKSIGLVLLATVVGYPLRPLIEPTNLVMLYLIAVIVAALSFGHRPAVLASVLSVAAFNFFFVPPYYTFVVANAEYLLTFGGLLAAGLVVSTLTAQARNQAQAARRRAAETQALYELSLSLSGSGDMEHIAQAVIRHLEQTLEGQVLVLIPDASAQDKLTPIIAPAGPLPTERELAVATWVWQHGQAAGRGTDTLAGSRGLYYPLKTAYGVAAVLGLLFPEDAPSLLPEQRRWLQAVVNQTAQAIERMQFFAEAQAAELLKETEKLQTTLLNSISHDLRTPLASITGVLSSLRDDRALLDETAQRLLINTAWEQADRLNRLVGNLLEMTRLEAGAVKVRRELSDVQDIIGVALSQLDERIGSREIAVDLPSELPLVPLDFRLMVQVVVNLVDNALKYSPPDAPILIRVRLEPGRLRLEVIDQGIGIPEADRPHIFDKFYRVQHTDKMAGTGLGLSICKGLVEAHGGQIWAEPNPKGGSIVTLTIPVEQPHD